MLSFSTKEGRETEEKFYTLAIEETEKGIINKALWAKALVESSNEIDKARAIYIKLRVQKYYDETRFEDEQERIQKESRK
jgi:hypothetical protein